jgi:hypothetical protein
MLEDFDVSNFKLKKPSNNNSMKTLQEIKEISRMNFDKDFVLYYDNIERVFKDILKRNNISFPSELYKNLINSSAKKILYLKNYHDRDRPREVAENFGLDLKVVNMPSARTKSYPSGHSAQAYLISSVFSEIYPSLKKEFKRAAENISKSRLVARVHFPSDSVFGEQIGLAMYNYLKYKNQ